MGSTAQIRREIPRLAFSQQGAAAALGASVDHFERHISNEELQKWHEPADGYLTARTRIYGRDKRASA